MAITFDAISGTNTFANSGAAKTVTLTIAEDADLVVAVFSVNAVPDAITFDGTGMTLAKAKSNGAGLLAQVYYMLKADLPGAGTYTLSIDPSAASFGAMGCFSLIGVKQAAPEATGEGSSTSSQASWANNITSITDGAWGVDAIGLNDRTGTVDGGQVERFDVLDGSAQGMFASTKPIASAGLTTMGWTPSTASPYAQAIAAFAPAAAFSKQLIMVS